ncbi:MAG: hypothetical protein IKZ93_06490, partial [Prevotella sp.]|nr:hypothetical protein [Prevotella sp.]
GCSNIQTISIPKNTSWIEQAAFGNCENVKDVYIYREKLPSIYGKGRDRFNSIWGGYITNATLHVPASAIEVYRSTKPWSEFGTIVAIEGTGIEQVSSDKSQVTSEEYYMLDGRKISSKPSAKGIYIVNGKKVIMK